MLQPAGSVVEICNLEEGTVQCPHNEVIVVLSAWFGRMSLGRCITSGQVGVTIGCYTIVWTKMDQLCSGKQTCHIQQFSEGDFKDGEHIGPECQAGLEKHLAVQFTCVTGTCITLYLFSLLRLILF